MEIPRKNKPCAICKMNFMAASQCRLFQSKIKKFYVVL